MIRRVKTVVVLVTLATTLFLMGGPRSLRTTAAEPAADPKSSVKLIVDYGDGVQKQFSAIPWREKMTVLDTLQWCTKHARGVMVKSRGMGSTAFVLQIDDLANEGSGRNWVFRVNDELGKSSSGVATVKAGDTILWRFEEYQ